MTVKIADFGLSRELMEVDHYADCDADHSTELTLALRWMPPEAVMDGRFDSKGQFVSDVVSGNNYNTNSNELSSY
jgi:hypothetical protein